MTHETHQTGSLCRVCGFQNQPKAEAQITKCECCGVRIGLEDQRASDVALWRAKWISNGGQWQSRPRKSEPTPATS